MRIVTKKSILRDWTIDDAESLVKHADNPRIAGRMRNSFPCPYTMDDAERFIALATSPGPNLFLVIEIDGVAVGGTGIHLLDDVRRRSAEIGYWLSESYWGNGIVTDAVSSLIPVAFEQFDIVRLQAGIFSNNQGSMRVLEKCGFFREAVHKHAIWKNGDLLHEVMYVHFGKNRIDPIL